jgi:hydrogenase maturation protease
MNEERRGRTLVLGLGNPVLSDDGVGLAVAAEVQRLIRAFSIDGVDVETSARGGFHLIDLLHGYERAVLVDCRASEDPTPGKVRQMSVAEVAGVARLVSVHDISAAEALETASLLEIPMPREIVIFAVDGADMSTLSEQLTPEVQASVAPLARRILELIRSHAPCGPAQHR